MLKVFLATLSPMLVLFSCILIGIIFTKRHLVPSDSDKVVSTFENDIFIPALTIVSFMNNCTVDSIKENLPAVLYSTLGMVIAFAMSIPLSHMFEKNDYYKRNIFLYGLTFANSGFMGNAIVVSVLGGGDTSVLYRYLLYTLPLNIVTYTWGIAILTPKDKHSGNPLKRLLNPTFISLIIGATIGLTGATKYVPTFIVTTLNYFNDCMAPLAMILTGLVIGSYSIKELLSDKKIYIATFLRLFILPAIIVAVLKICGASDFILTMALIATATPLGLNTVVFPAAYGGDTHTGAAMAVVSHTLCVITIPIMYTLLVSTF